MQVRQRDQHPGVESFRTRDSTSVGLSPGRLRRRGIAHPFTGVNVVGAAPGSAFERARSYAVLLCPDEFFSHATAAILWGAQLPLVLEQGPLHVIRIGDARARGRGVIGHRSDPDLLQTTRRHGLPVVSPSDAWVQLASMISREDLIAVGDRFVTGVRIRSGRDRPVAELRHLESAVRRHSGARGLRTARWALPYVRTGVDSRRETRLRLVLVFGGLPEPEIGVEIDIGGGRMAHPDLAYRRQRVAIEYEGDMHRLDTRTFRTDIARREAMEAAGWRVIRVTADDLRDPAALVQRVRRILLERSVSAGF